MPTYSYGGFNGSGDRPDGHTDVWFYYDFNMPSIRQAADGTRPGMITGASVKANGLGSTSSMSVLVDNLESGRGASSASAKTLAQASSATTMQSYIVGGTGFYPGETIRVKFSVDGGTYFDRNDAGPGFVVTSYNSNQPGSLEGDLTYIEVPAAPSMVSVTTSTDGTAATVKFTAGDTGGGAITAWLIQRAENSAFTLNPQVVVAGTSTTAIITGLTPGTQYYWKVAGRNRAADFGSTSGPYSSSLAAVQGSPTTTAGKRFNGTTFVPAMARRFNGTTFVPAVGKRFNGTTWVDIG